MAAPHAKLSPSSAHRWTRCAGSVELEAGIPNVDTEYSVDGTITHALAEYCLNNDIWTPSSLVGKTVSLQVRNDVHELLVEADRAARVGIYLDHVAGLLLHPDYITHAVEARMEIGASLGIANCFGTADLVALIGTTLHVVDYKDGRGEIVHPDGNEQLILYGQGARTCLPPDMKVTDVTLTIVQPKTQSRPESHTYTMPEFLEQVARIKAAAERIAPDSPRVAGEKQCRFCKARGVCPEAKSLAYEKAAGLFAGEVIVSNTTPVPVDVTQLPEDKLVALLEHDAFIRQTLDACASEAKRRISTGGSVAGFKMVAGKNSRSWSDTGTPEALAAALHCSTDFFYVKERKTPAALEKELPSGGKKVIEPFIVKTSGAPVLVKDSDKRQALVYNAERLFDAVDGEAPAALSFM